MNDSVSTSVLPSLSILRAGSGLQADPAAADRHAAAVAGLPHSEALLDDRALSALLGREVTITHLRIKPGHSMVVSHRDAEPSPGRSTGPLPETGWGWTSVSDDADKFAKALMRAEQIGQPLNVHRDSSPFLASGSVWTDRVLAKELGAVHETLGEETAWQILRYNPRRRVIAVVTRRGEDGRRLRHVVRIACDDLSGLLEAAGRWRRLGAPLTNMRAVGGRGTATLTPLWGSGDLLNHPCAPAARTAGTVIAEVHSRGADLTGDHCPGAPPPSSQQLSCDPERPARAVASIAPWLAERARTLAETLRQRLQSGTGQAGADQLGADQTGAGQTELHGDLSPDQVLIASPESHKIRIIDLDRTGRGPAMRDVGSWMAACRQACLPELSEAFLSGYTAVAALDRAAMHTWEAYAHLASALDDFRHREPSWPASLTRRIELAELAVRR